MKLFRILVALLFITSCSTIPQKQFSEDVYPVIDQQRDSESSYVVGRHKETSAIEYAAPPDLINPFLNESYDKDFSKVLVSIHTAGTVPVKDLILQIAKTSGLNISIEQEIAQRVAVKIDNQPARAVIKSITKVSNLRYSEENQIIYITNDKPITKGYRVNLLDEQCTESSPDGCSNNEQLKSIENNIRFIVQHNEILKDADRTSVDPNTGIILVNAIEKTHTLVENYISQVHSVMGLQAVIDVRMVQVNLNKNYNSGVLWDELGAFTETSNGIKTSTLDEPRIEEVLQKLEKFGSLKMVLSSKIRASNNRTSTIELTKNEHSNKETSSNVWLSVRPVIDPITNTISMHILPLFYELKPSINTDLSQQNDMEGYISQQQKTESIVNIHNEEIAVLAGMATAQRIKIYDKSSKDEGHEKKTLSEIIIFLKATIVEPYSSTLQKNEKTLYAASMDYRAHAHHLH